MNMESFYDIFKQLNAIPRPSHHETKVADFLCRFAEEHGLKYRRDAENCVVIEKDATPGCEEADPVVILNHMDMVCVAKDGYLREGRAFNPLEDEIRAYTEEVTNSDGSVSRWMKAEGTSLGADNGMGLAMALAVLADDSIVHGPLEVLTTTNEEDGMSGAEALSCDFIKGRKVINLDSEAYDEITTGAAGAYLQVGHWKAMWDDVPEGMVFKKITIDGGLGGHSGVDINKGRCNCIKQMGECLAECASDLGDTCLVCSMSGGTANASIASWAEVVVALKPECVGAWEERVKEWNERVVKKYEVTDPMVRVRMENGEVRERYLMCAPVVLRCVYNLPFGVMEMRSDMPGTVMTSNNIGVLKCGDDEVTLSCHSRSFSDEEMHRLADRIRMIFKDRNTDEVEVLMDTPAWMERTDSPLLELTCKTFKDVLGFEPKKVAMHFVLEAAYYVQKYPGVEIASIGPLIIEPHSTSERVNLDTADDIWKVTVELLKRLAQPTPLSDYEKYCKEQAEVFFDELGDDRCFGEMAEGQFVRGH